VRLDDDQSFTEAEGMDPGFGAILDQDTDNLLLQQEGLEASAKPGITLGNYQEIRIRHFERAIDKYLQGQGPNPCQANFTRFCKLEEVPPGGKKAAKSTRPGCWCAM
jgi:hypothetical protein